MVEQTEPGWITQFHSALAALDANEVERAKELFVAADAARASLGATAGAAHGGVAGDGPSRFYLDLLEANEPIPDGVVELRDK